MGFFPNLFHAPCQRNIISEVNVLHCFLEMSNFLYFSSADEKRVKASFNYTFYVLILTLHYSIL